MFRRSRHEAHGAAVVFEVRSEPALLEKEDGGGVQVLFEALVSHIPPPCIRFKDNKIWKLRLTHLKVSCPDMAQQEEAKIENRLQQVVEQVLDLETRWQKFRLANLNVADA